MRSLAQPPPLAEFFCYQCRQPFCSSCHRALHSLTAHGRGGRQHIVIPLVPEEWTYLDEEGMTYCRKHGDFPLSVFCLTCETTVCEECQRELHAEHEVWNFWVNLQNAHNVLRGRLCELEDHLRMVGRLMRCLRNVGDAIQLPSPQEGLSPVAAATGDSAEGRRAPQRRPESLQWTPSQEALNSVQSLFDHPDLKPESPKAQRNPMDKKRKRTKGEDCTLPSPQSSYQHCDGGVLAAAATATAAAAASADNAQFPEPDFARHCPFQNDSSPSRGLTSDRTRDTARYSCTSHPSQSWSDNPPSGSGRSEEEDRRSYSEVAKAGCAPGSNSLNNPPKLASALNSPPLLTGMAEARVIEPMTFELNAVSSRVDSSGQFVPCGGPSSEASSSVCELSDQPPPRQDASSDRKPPPCMLEQVEHKSSGKIEGNGLLDDSPSAVGVLSKTVTQCVSAEITSSDPVTFNTSLEQSAQPESAVSVEPTQLDSELSEDEVLNSMASMFELLEAGSPRSEASNLGTTTHGPARSPVLRCFIRQNVVSDAFIESLSSSSNESSNMNEIHPSNPAIPVTTTSEADSALTAHSVNEIADVISSLFPLSDTTSSEMTSSRSPSSNPVSDMTSPSTVWSNVVSEVVSSNATSSDGDLPEMVSSNSVALDSSSLRSISRNPSSSTPLSSEFKPSNPASDIVNEAEGLNDVAQNGSVSRTNTDNSASTQENTDTFPKNTASSCMSSQSCGCGADSLTSAQQGAGQNEGSAVEERHDPQSETSSAQRANSTGPLPEDTHTNTDDTDESVTTNDPETGESIWGDLHSESTDAASNHVGSSDNSQLEGIVRDVFGESFSQHVWAVETVYSILQARTDILAYDLHMNRLGCVSSIFTWMRARPAVSSEMYAVLKALFPDTPSQPATSGCVPGTSHDSSKNPLRYNSNVSDGWLSLNIEDSDHGAGQSRACELISEVGARLQGFSAGEEEDRHVVGISSQELEPDYLDWEGEVEDFFDNEKWM